MHRVHRERETRDLGPSGAPTQSGCGRCRSGRGALARVASAVLALSTEPCTARALASASASHSAADDERLASSLDGSAPGSPRSNAARAAAYSNSAEIARFRLAVQWQSSSPPDRMRGRSLCAGRRGRAGLALFITTHSDGEHHVLFCQRRRRHKKPCSAAMANQRMLLLTSLPCVEALVPQP